ncbi:MAG TPA: FAD-dependent oxidoreductase, partial [Geminicoccaceae bacterium]|nr:FAD-dependent oxidoreductase [Geminicoccaceae bacterium]
MPANASQVGPAATPGPAAAASTSLRPVRCPRVVIVGAGFGGLAAAKALARTPADVVLIDRRNYHLFQPLLYQVATAALSPADIAWPIRSIFSRQANVAVQMGKVSRIDARAREVILDDRRVAYDHLV